VSGVETTRRQILIYSVLLLPVCAWLALAGDLSWIFTATAAVSGAAFVVIALRLWRDPANMPPMNLYLYSLLYLALVFVAIGADVAILS
jgi:protoheme IX farnesyltransferase